MRVSPIVAGIWLLGASFALAQTPSATWLQWGGDPRHSGRAGVGGQSPLRVLADIMYDPFVQSELRAGRGDLLVHYQSVLVDSGGAVFIEAKSGTFTSFASWQTQVWNERRYDRAGGRMKLTWNFASDWKPVPHLDTATGNGPAFEPVFHAAIDGSAIVVPGAGGTVFLVNKSTGKRLKRYNPFGGSVNPHIYVTGPITVSSGNIYYNALQLARSLPWQNDVVNSWLVKIAPGGKISRATYTSLTPGAPAATSMCEASFDPSTLPWPPSPTAAAPLVRCGSQRPGINVAPAVAPDGTIYTVSRAHLDDRYGYLIAVAPGLHPKWASSLRDRLQDGCNVGMPPNGTSGGCRTGAANGVDPATNHFPAGRVVDSSTSSPAVAPDGSVLYGAYTRYNFSQGHLMKFSRNGEFQAAFPFGWDITPGTFPHGGKYSIVIKENHYPGGSYCNDSAICPPDRSSAYPNDPERYFITRLSPAMQVDWRFQNRNTPVAGERPGEWSAQRITRTALNGASTAWPLTPQGTCMPAVRTETCT